MDKTKRCAPWLAQIDYKSLLEAFEERVRPAEDLNPLGMRMLTLKPADGVLPLRHRIALNNAFCQYTPPSVHAFCHGAVKSFRR